MTTTTTSSSALAGGHPLAAVVAPGAPVVSRKRRPSDSCDLEHHHQQDPILDDCAAAMVLMSLSCSPKSPLFPFDPHKGRSHSWALSQGGSSADSGFTWRGLASSSSSRTTTPSPPSLTTSGSGSNVQSPSSGAGSVDNPNASTGGSSSDNSVDSVATPFPAYVDEGIELEKATLSFGAEDTVQTSSDHPGHRVRPGQGIKPSFSMTLEPSLPGHGRQHKRRQAPSQRILFQCTWRGCGRTYDLCKDVEKHIWTVHLGLSKNSNSKAHDREEEFYYTEIEVDENEDLENVQSAPGVIRRTPESSSVSNQSSNGSPAASPCPSFLGGFSAPTWSHLDMVRPPTEDPEYKKSLMSSPINIPGAHGHVAPNGATSSMTSSVHSFCASVGGAGAGTSLLSLSSPKTNKFMRLSNHSSKAISSLPTSSRSLLLSPPVPGKVTPGGPEGNRSSGRLRRELRKCRKIYGMEARDMWCTQCKWKKACTRFSD